MAGSKATLRLAARKLAMKLDPGREKKPDNKNRKKAENQYLTKI